VMILDPCNHDEFLDHFGIMLFDDIVSLCASRGFLFYITLSLKKCVASDVDAKPSGGSTLSLALRNEVQV
jgi:hypothetical protein